MKNLKKTLAVVLAFAMVFSMGIINTFAFSDVEAGTVVDEAVGILSNLSILEGFEDGTFKPEETVTRAQMAAIICRTLGFESQAQSSMGTTVFTDVAADSWASGYINVAQAQGIINGYGNGLFGPNDKVTYEQAVKMIVAALGYDVAAAAKGGYPTGYLAIASAEGITKNANGRVGDAALRATVAVLVYNALEVRLMDQNSWSTDGSDTYAKTTETILSKYLNVSKWEGILEADTFTNYAENGYDEDAIERISLDSAAFTNVYNEKGSLEPVKNTGSNPPASDVNASLVDTTGLLGKRVIAYIGNEEDPATDECMVYALNEKSKANSSVAINALQLVKDDTDADMIRYTEPGSTKVKEIELEASPVIYKNYVKDTSESITNTATLYDAVKKGGVVEFISNDADKKIEYIIIKAYEKEYVVETATEKEGVFRYENYTTEGISKIDTTKEDQLHIVYKDGALAEVKDIEANNTVSMFELNGKKVYLYYVSSKAVTGAVEGYDSKVVVINGEEYQLDMTGKAPKDLAKTEGIYFIDVDGRIAWYEADKTAGTIGILLAVAQGTGFESNTYKARVALADGSVAIYELDKDAEFDTADTAKAVAEKLAGGSVPANGYTTDYVDAVDSTFEFTFKDGKITKIDKLEVALTPVTAGSYDAEANSYGKYDFADDALVFAIKADKEAKDIDPDVISVGAVSEFFADKDEKAAGTFFVADEDKDDYIDLILGFNLVPSVSEDGALITITDKKVIRYGDGEAVRIEGIQAGEEVTYTIYNEKYTVSTNPENLAVGDVIIVSTPSEEGVVSNFRHIFTAANGGALKDVKNDVKDLYTAYRTLTEIKAERFLLDGGEIKNSYDGGQTFDEDPAEGLKMTSKANYVIVDYTESTDYPTIEAESAATALEYDKEDPEYTAKVLVRICDDKIADVVVYRFAK